MDVDFDKLMHMVYNRYMNEFIDNNRSVLAKCLVGDSSISSCMVLVIVDIEKVQNDTIVMRLSDMYYTINIIFKASQGTEETVFLKDINNGVYKLGMKLKCQNIFQSKEPLELQTEYSNPVVHAQHTETFKISQN